MKVFISFFIHLFILFLVWTSVYLLVIGVYVIVTPHHTQWHIL